MHGFIWEQTVLLKNSSSFIYFTTYLRVEMDALKYIIICMLYRYSFSSFSESSSFTELFMRCRSKCGSDKCNSLCYSLHLFSKKSNCSTHCKSEFKDIKICPELCKLGEKFIAKGIKQGTCPTDMDGFALARINQCKNDMDCQGSLKCCSNKQWQLCQPAVFKIDSKLSPIPSYVKVRVETSSVAHILWKAQRRKATVYHVELRYSAKIVKPSQDELTSWQSAGQTTRRSLKVKGLIPGAWYQFRISAWSENGTNGFNVSDIVQLPGLIRRPSQPRNISASGAWFRDGKVDVELAWQSPLILDGPVRRYRVLWYRHVLGSVQHYHPVQVHRIRVRGGKMNALLKGLELNSVYMVQIQALIRGAGQPRIKGRWKSVLIKTPEVNKSRDDSSNGTAKPYFTTPPTKPPTKAPTKIKKKSWSKPFPGAKYMYKSKEQVRAVNISLSRLIVSRSGYPLAILNCDASENVNALRVSWTPENCSVPVRPEARSKLVATHRREVTLLELRPNCMYNVKVTPFLPGGRRGRVETVTFSTDIEKIIQLNEVWRPTREPTKGRAENGMGSSGSRARSQCLLIMSFLLPIWWTFL